jgi:hypothetical protein
LYSPFFGCFDLFTIGKVSSFGKKWKRMEKWEERIYYHDEKNNVSKKLAFFF